VNGRTDAQTGMHLKYAITRYASDESEDAARTSIVVVELVLRCAGRCCPNRGLEVVQTEVSDLKDPSTVD